MSRQINAIEQQIAENVEFNELPFGSNKFYFYNLFSTEKNLNVIQDFPPLAHL